MASKAFWHNMGGIQNQWWSDIKHQTKRKGSNFTRDTWYWSGEKDLRPDKFFKIFKMQNKHNKRYGTMCPVMYQVEYEEKHFIWLPNRIVYLTIEWKEEYNIFKLTLCLKDGSFHKVDCLVELKMSSSLHIYSTQILLFAIIFLRKLILNQQNKCCNIFFICWHSAKKINLWIKNKDEKTYNILGFNTTTILHEILMEFSLIIHFNWYRILL